MEDGRKTLSASAEIMLSVLIWPKTQLITGRGKNLCRSYLCETTQGKLLIHFIVVYLFMLICILWACEHIFIITATIDSRL